MFDLNGYNEIRDFADFCGISYRTIYRWKTGAPIPKWAEICWKVYKEKEY